MVFAFFTPRFFERLRFLMLLAILFSFIMPFSPDLRRYCRYFHVILQPDTPFLLLPCFSFAADRLAPLFSSPLLATLISYFRWRRLPAFAERRLPLFAMLSAAIILRCYADCHERHAMLSRLPLTPGLTPRQLTRAAAARFSPPPLISASAATPPFSQSAAAAFSDMRQQLRYRRYYDTLIMRAMPEC